MNGTDIQVSICGSAGDGTIAAGEILRNVMAEIGYRAICFDVYPSEIRGFGTCIARLRISTQQAYSLKSRADVMVSLNDSHAIAHVGEVRDYGAVIYERSSIVDIPVERITGFFSAATRRKRSRSVTIVRSCSKSGHSER